MKKIAPSKIRYQKSHPLISFRCSIEEKDKLESMMGIEGKSLSQILREMLLNGYTDFENTYNEGYDAGNKEAIKAGYEKGKNEWGIRIPCPICCNDLYLKPNDAWHKFIIEYVKSYGWGHVACHEKAKSQQ